MQRRAVRVSRPGRASSRRRSVGARRGRCSGSPSRLGAAEQVVREAGDHRPGGVGVEVAEGEVAERLVFQVADHERDRRVLAMLFLDQLERLGPVADKGEVLPGRKQLLLGVERADARTISRSSPRVVSAISASPVSGWSASRRHAASSICSIAAVTSLVSRTPIE